MSDYEVVFPPDARYLDPALATLERAGKDGVELVAPVFGGDNFIGEALSGKWKKYAEANMVDFIARLASSHLELAGKTNAAGTDRYGYLISNSKFPMKDGAEFVVEIEVPASVTSPRLAGVEVFLCPTDPAGGDPVDEDNWVKIHFQNDDGTYEYKVRKKVAGTESDVIAWTELDNATAIFKLAFVEDVEGNTYVYVDDGESGTYTEHTSSPFSLGLAFDLAYVLACLRTTDATSRTCQLDYITTSHPNFDVEYKLPRGDKPGIESTFAEAEDETLGSGVGTSDLDDDSGTSAVLNAQNEYCRWSLVCGTGISAGRYIAQFRIKDTAQVADDVELRVYNSTDGAFRNIEGAAVTKTVLGTYVVYTLLFDITDEDVSGGDTVYLQVLKSTATANTIYVDWYRFTPYYGVENGRVKAFDTLDEASESDWREVYDEDRAFAGDMVVQNGLFRLFIDRAVQYGLKAYYWNGEAWTQPLDRLYFYLASDAVTLAYPYIRGLIALTSEKAVLDVRVEDTAVQDGDYYVDLRVTLERGKPFMQIEVQAVYPIQDLRTYFLNSTALRFGYPGDAESHGIGDDDLNLTGSNTTLSDNFIVAFDNAGTAMLGFVFTNIQPDTHFQASDGGDLIIEDYTPAKYASAEIVVGLVTFSRVVSLYTEAEDETLGGGAGTSDEGDDSGESAELDAQNETVTWTLNPINNYLPKGRYLALFRIKDANQVADDVGLRVYNDSDSTYLNEENAQTTKTATASFAYYQTIFDIDGDDLGDSVSLRVIKVTATANTIYVDYFLLVPLGNGESWPADLAHNFLRKLGSQRKIFDRKAEVNPGL